eukprot:14153881-Ditylum_brightwellii.AAC.1
MSPNLSCSDCTFTPIIENPESFDQLHLPILQQLSRIHSKYTAYMVATSKVKGCNAMSGFYYEQQIPLLCKVLREFSKEEDGNGMFHETKFIQYSNGSTFCMLNAL